jgi:hypothetical protein
MESTQVFMQQFNQLYIQQLQGRQELVKSNEVGALYDRYLNKNKERSSKTAQKKILEQILLALPLWLITLPPPENLSPLDYIKFITEIDEDLQAVHDRIKTSFDLQ